MKGLVIKIMYKDRKHWYWEQAILTKKPIPPATCKWQFPTYAMHWLQLWSKPSPKSLIGKVLNCIIYIKLMTTPCKLICTSTIVSQQYCKAFQEFLASRNRITLKQPGNKSVSYLTNWTKHRTWNCWKWQYIAMVCKLLRPLRSPILIRSATDGKCLGKGYWFW